MKHLVFCIFLLFNLSAHAVIVDRIVAIVNNQIITLSDIEDYKKKIAQGGFVDDTLFRIADAKAIVKDRNALIQHMINESILDAEIKKKELTVTVERVEQEMRMIAKRNGINRNQLKGALKEKGVDFAEYQDFIKRTIERKSLIDKEIAGKIKISDDDLLSYYNSHEGNGQMQSYEYTVSHLLFRGQKGGEKAALERAQAVYKKIKDDAKAFGSYAEQYSEDPNFNEGGLLGTFKDGELSKELDQALKKLDLNAVSQPVKVKDNYYILKITKRTPISNPQFEAQKDKILNVLYADLFKRQLSNWLEQKRQELFIRIN